MSSIKEVFDRVLSHVKFDKHLATLFFKQRISFLNKNSEHLEFFGGGLTGVQVVRFTSSDFSKFFDEILGIDPIGLQEELHELPSVNKDHKVGSDAFNLTCMYLVHRFLTSPMLDPKHKEQVCVDILLLFNYKCLTSLLSTYFRYPCDIKLAKATYDSLSFRFLIKKLGTWQKVLEFRCHDVLDKNGLHLTNLVKFLDDDRIMYAVADSQGRVRDMLKNIYAEMILVQQSGYKINSTANTGIDADGEAVFKDKLGGLESYISYIVGLTGDRNSFIKQELIGIVLKMMHVVQERGFVKSLEWISLNILNQQEKEVEEFVTTTITHSHNYLTSNEFNFKNTRDISLILSKLKGAYSSSRSTDKDLERLRTIGEEIVQKALGKTNAQAAAALRTSLMLYVCLRAYTRDHYSS